MERVPCRVSTELRQHQAEQNAADRARETPNFADADDLHGVVDKALHAPLAQLFATRDQIRSIRGTGALNHDRAIEWLLKDLTDVERALRALWEAA